MSKQAQPLLFLSGVKSPSLTTVVQHSDDACPINCNWVVRRDHFVEIRRAKVMAARLFLLFASLISEGVSQSMDPMFVNSWLTSRTYLLILMNGFCSNPWPITSFFFRLMVRLYCCNRQIYISKNKHITYKKHLEQKTFFMTVRKSNSLSCEDFNVGYVTTDDG